MQSNTITHVALIELSSKPNSYRFGGVEEVRTCKLEG